ncbi:organic hydroperoxide resistance protein [Clavibacter michiganensis subsp. insidiosus]|uniref:Organic hydroperoxide resistance protein n=1 Tax=Clavibacter michiganensis subsp. insidiosus TaxID=33014 RepID=A0A399SKN4_9MICO|nr:organic hydroperoxide resistance protein [Clavibacter michiganensis]AWG00565.1 hydroperoxide resistance protein [Clavibacter michiganensis subsp. insidiosus]OQJ60821.1 organic hydroperoxide resistance protein [Clavibacter michiganensis subsp. insidiosus]RII86551.1 organic hydroperoxide resistance protein [Clavibacter michiganensis subsp. insidiosus]RIJ44150.1 organic hydroperoxide resistance protein [Clavibacter michiganensis subsp. insidiosus]RMC84246.1 organic hydroperoxide resistance pro
MEPIYTAIAHASGGGRDGHVRSEDDRIDFDTRPPKEMGGSGEGTNPEQLFAAGYSACFLGATHLVGKNADVDTKDAGVSASVSIGDNGQGGFGLAVELDVYLPNVAPERRQEIADAAHQVCPYSNATRGNIDVKVTIVD